MRGLAFLFFFFILLLPFSDAQVEGEVSPRTPTETEHFSTRKFLLFAMDLFYIPELISEARALFSTFYALGTVYEHIENMRTILDKCLALTPFFVLSSLCAYLSTYFPQMKTMSDVLLPVINRMPFCNSPLTEAPATPTDWAFAPIEKIAPLLRI